MRLIFLLLTIAVGQSAFAGEFSYDEFSVNIQAVDSDSPDRDNIQYGLGLDASWAFGDQWFLVGGLSVSDYDYSYEYRDQAAFFAEMGPFWEFDVDANEKRLYSEFGIGRYWSVTATTDVTFVAKATYTDVDWTADYLVELAFYSPNFWNPDRRNVTYSETGRSVDHSSDTGYRGELGVRQKLGSDIEVFGRYAYVNHYDTSGEAWHAGVRYTLIEDVDTSLRYVRTHDVEALWLGVVIGY